MKHVWKAFASCICCIGILLAACEQNTPVSINNNASSTEATSQASSLSWKTYKSRYQFSFDYPSDIQLKEEFDEKKLSGYNFDANDINQVTNPEGLSPHQYKIEVSMNTKSSQGCTKASLNNHPEDSSLVIEKMTVSGFPGYKWAPADGSAHLICFTFPQGTVSAAIYGDTDQERFINSFAAN